MGHSSAVSWPWKCGAEVFRLVLSSLSHQKIEEGKFTTVQHRFGSLKRLWGSPNVLVKQFEAAHSHASYEPPILHVRSLSSPISVRLAQTSFVAGQSCSEKETSYITQALFVGTVPVANLTGFFGVCHTTGSSQQGCLHCLQWNFGHKFWKQQARPLGVGQ